jgi:hypothetical protein
MLLWLFAAVAPAAAQPADCNVSGPPPGVMPLSIDLAGHPGVPSTLSGQVGMGVPVGAGGGMACTDAPPPPRDVLRGAPSDDLLLGPAVTGPVDSGEPPAGGMGPRFQSAR